MAFSTNGAAIRPVEQKYGRLRASAAAVGKGSRAPTESSVRGDALSSTAYQPVESRIPQQKSSGRPFFRNGGPFPAPPPVGNAPLHIPPPPLLFSC